MNKLLFDRSNIKLSFRAENYFVDSDKGIVECRLNYSINVPSAMRNIFKLTGNDSLAGDVSVGVATCKHGDTFDLKTGKKVARTIAESKAYNTVCRRITRRLLKVCRALSAASLMANEFTFKSRAIVSHNQKYTKRITR